MPLPVTDRLSPRPMQIRNWHDEWREREDDRHDNGTHVRDDGKHSFIRPVTTLCPGHDASTQTDIAPWPASVHLEGDGNPVHRGTVTIQVTPYRTNNTKSS